ncbi:MAG: hypothetical protein MK179_07640 [Pirellulaceae bacterium]|nr:hypothetical protein [Pirellulaceae bacterium]
MAEERRVVRKLKHSRKLSFDEKLWPINLAIMVLAAFLVGIMVVRFSVQTGRVSLIGTCLIAALILLSVSTMTGLRFVHQRTLQRGTQLAAVLSLLTHLVLLFSMAIWPIHSRVAEIPEAPPDPMPPEFTAPELVTPHLNQGEQRKPDFLRPVETQTVETGATNWTRSSDTGLEQAPLIPRSYLSDEKVRPQPSITPRQRPAETAPREAPTESRLSHRESARPQPQVAAHPVDLPSLPETVEAAPTSQLIAETSPSSRTTSEPPDLPTSTANAFPTSNPPEAVVIQEPTQASPTQPQAEEPSRRTVRPTTQPTLTETILAVAKLTPQPAETHEDKPPVLTEIRRQSSDLTATAAERSRVDPSQPATARQTDIAQPTRRKSESTAEPTIQRHEPFRPQTTPHTQPSQSQLAVQSLGPVAQPTADDLQNEVHPAPTALNRSIDGVTGIGHSENLGHSSPARGGPSMVAAVSVTRITATQNNSPGPAMQPSERVQIPQLRSDNLRPTSVFRAQPVEIAVTYGSQNVATMDASSAATIHRQAADAILDQVTATVGSAAVDLGIQRIVAEDGSGRASGGGRPKINPAQSNSAWKLTAPNVRQQITAVNSTPDVPNSVRAEQVGETSPSSNAVPTGQSVARTTTAVLLREAETVAIAEEADPPPRLLNMETAARPLRRTSESAWQTSEQVNQQDSSVASPTEHKQPFRPRSETAFNDFAFAKSKVEVQVSHVEQTTDSPSPERAQADVNSSSNLRRNSVAETVLLPEVETEGPGGLFLDLQASVGITTQRTPTASELVAFHERRFVMRDYGGNISLGGVDQVSAPAFSKRMSRVQGDQLGSNPGQDDARIDETIELGLAFLARHQSPHGNWSLQHFAAGKPYQDQQSQVALNADTGATGLALLAFLGAGYHHQSNPYGGVVQTGLKSLIQSQSENGNLFLSEDETSNQSVALYSHGIATIALCEAYGMTLDPELREPTERALNYIVATQHPRRGGWRYQPQVGSDTSVTGWMLMALKSAQMAHLEVPEHTWAGLERFMSSAEVANHPHLFRYNPYAPDTERQRHGRLPSDTMTAVGLLIRLYTGSNRTDELMIMGAEYLAAHLPAPEKRDTYYWYYATQIMFHMGDQYWNAWRESLFPLLTDSQVTNGPLAGSWDPLRPVRDKWGHHAGRVYVTTLNLLSLEVAYRHLPIYEDFSLRNR